MSTNKDKMNKMMTLRNFSPKTKEAYIGAVQRITNYHKKGPEKLTTEEIQDYILNMREQKGLSWSTCNVAISGLHFFLPTF